MSPACHPTAGRGNEGGPCNLFYPVHSFLSINSIIVGSLVPIIFGETYTNPQENYLKF